jgi:predicted transposase YbfD/YdcC
MLNGYLDWPDAGQVFEPERVRRVGDKAALEVVYGITSLGRDEADAKALLALARAHWRIENRLHYARDETLGEGRCRVRKGPSPQVLAALRNAVVHLLEEVDAPSKAAATREVNFDPSIALSLL